MSGRSYHGDADAVLSLRLWLFSACSPHSVPDRLRLRVNRMSLQEYEKLQFDKESLRDICECMRMAYPQCFVRIK